MAVHPLAGEINVSDQLQDRGSVLEFWRHMLAFRREHSGLFVYGRFDLLDLENPDTITFVKTSSQGEKAVVVLNFTGKPISFDPLSTGVFRLDSENNPVLNVIASTVETKTHDGILLPYEGRVYLV